MLTTYLHDNNTYTTWLQSSLSNSPNNLKSYSPFVPQVLEAETDTKASRPRALFAVLSHLLEILHLEGGGLTAPSSPCSAPPQLVSFSLGAPPPGTKRGAPAVGATGAGGPGTATPPPCTMRNYQLQSAGTSLIGKKEGRRQTRPTSNSGNLRAGGRLEKVPFPGREEKGGGDENRPPGPGGEPCAHTGPRPRGPLPRLLSASGSLP